MKYFNRTYPEFSEESLNVRLGLSTNRFASHGQYGRTYSYWLLILTSYNLSLGMCISSEYMFITMVVLGPSNPKRLVEELL